MKKILGMFVFCLCVSSSFAQDTLCYIPASDATLATMYPKNQRTYRLLFGKEFPIIQVKNISLLSKTEKDKVTTHDSLFFPLVQIPKAAWHETFVKNKTLILVDVDSLQLFYYKQGVLFLSVHIAEGTSKKNRLKADTILIISEKIKHRRSKKYENAPMTYSLNLYGGRFLHAGEVITGRDSHGCIRVPYVYAREIFSQVNIGDTIILQKPPQNFLLKTPQ